MDLVSVAAKQLISRNNRILYPMFSEYVNYSKKALTRLTNPQNFRKSFCFESRIETYEYFLGKLSLPIRDTNQLTLARLTDDELLSGLDNVSESRNSASIFALLPTFVGYQRLCHSLSIRFYVGGRINMCLSCLSQDCCCFDYKFSKIIFYGCTCCGMICSCDALPPMMVCLFELANYYYNVFPEIYEHIGDEKWNLEQQQLNQANSVVIPPTIMLFNPTLLFLICDFLPP